MDAAFILTCYITILFAIPSAFVVGALGSAGSPSAIVAIGCFGWWVWYHVNKSNSATDHFQPVRAALILWLLVMFVAYIHAMSGPMSGDEISPADNGLLKLLGFSGVLLLATDGLTSIGRFEALVRHFVIAVGIVALFGLFQYVTKQLWIDRISVPGLTSGLSGQSLIGRTGFVRPSATATHPIEYGVVLTMALPLMIVFASRAPSRRWLYRALLTAVALAVFLSLSRSAALCAVAGLVTLAFTWSNATRLRALGFVLAIGTIVYVTVPGSLGAFLGLFTTAGEDPSIGSRTGSYDLAFALISNSPVIGRGFGTFMPKYWILDNGYLGLMIEAGVVGLAALLVLIGTSAWAAYRARKAARTDFHRDICQGLLAGVIAGATGMAFFDTFGFPQSAGSFFLLLGLCGAAYRLMPACGRSSAESDEASSRRGEV